MAVALVMVALAACGSGAHSPGPVAGVAGLVLLGPTCPVESADDPCPDRPAEGVTVTLSAGGTVQATDGRAVIASTDGDGRFRVTLGPGVYAVSVDAGMSCPPVIVRVEDSRYAEVELVCDTGIR